MIRSSWNSETTLHNVFPVLALEWVRLTRAFAAGRRGGGGERGCEFLEEAGVLQSLLSAQRGQGF